MANDNIRIDEGLHSLMLPLSDEERRQLEENLVRDGCREPLTIWRQEKILLDGHNRKEICDRRGIGYRVVEVELPDRDAAEDWIDANQLGRRNLTPDQSSIIRGRIYNRAKAGHGGDRTHTAARDKRPASCSPFGTPGGHASDRRERLENGDGAKCQNDDLKTDLGASRQNDDLLEKTPPKTENGDSGASSPKREKTARSLAKRLGVSARTIERDGRFAEAVEKLKQVDPDIEKKVVSGNGPAKKKVIAAAKVADKPEEAKKVLADEPDPIKDGLGNPVDGKLAEVFTNAERFDQALNLLRQVSTLLNPLLGSEKEQSPIPGGEMLASNRQQFSVDLKNVRNAIKFARPYAPCPYPHGKAECNACKGLGWVVQSTYDNAPKSYKAGKGAA